MDSVKTFLSRPIGSGVKTFLARPSGSGVYVRQTNVGLKVCIVYRNGYLCDWPVKYDNGRIGCDGQHCKTVVNAVLRAFKWLERYENGNNN